MSAYIRLSFDFHELVLVEVQLSAFNVFLSTKSSGINVSRSSELLSAYRTYLSTKTSVTCTCQSSALSAYTYVSFDEDFCLEGVPVDVQHIRTYLLTKISVTKVFSSKFSVQHLYVRVFQRFFLSRTLLELLLLSAYTYVSFDEDFCHEDVLVEVQRSAYTYVFLSTSQHSLSHKCKNIGLSQ